MNRFQDTSNIPHCSPPLPLLIHLTVFGVTGMRRDREKELQQARDKRIFPSISLTLFSGGLIVIILTGMARKQAEREKKELQQAIDTGMVQAKGMGKKKRRLKEQERRSNLGLVEVRPRSSICGGGIFW